MKKILVVILTLCLLFGVTLSAQALAFTDAGGSISSYGTVVTGSLYVSADCTCTDIGGVIAIKERWPGGEWQSSGGTVNFNHGAFNHSFTFSVAGTYGKEYKLLNTFIASIDGGDYISTPEIDMGQLFLAWPPTTFDSAWCSASRSGSSISSTASCNMNQLCQSFSIKQTLQRKNLLTTTWDNISSHTSTHGADTGYAYPTSFSGSSGQTYRVKAVFTVTGPDGSVVTTTKYSGSVVTY